MVILMVARDVDGENNNNDADADDKEDRMLKSNQIIYMYMYWFCGKGKTGVPEEDQQTQPMFDEASQNQTWDTCADRGVLSLLCQPFSPTIWRLT